LNSGVHFVVVRIAFVAQVRILVGGQAQEEAAARGERPPSSGEGVHAAARRPASPAAVSAVSG
jgi:hypothetical protein